MMRFARGSAVFMGLFGLGACMGGHDMGADGMDTVPRVLPFPPAPGPFAMAEADDRDPDPAVVDISLEAKIAEVELAPGTRLPMWTYNGVFPGPQISAGVGNTVRVRFKNSLPEPTTIHWHGVRVPTAMDGVPAMQKPVEPGAEFLYEFIVPDAGTFWYHPHIRSDEQVERGLYGAFIVRGDNEPSFTTERTVVLDDLLLGADGHLAPSDVTTAMLGRQGNVIVANGRAHPIVPLAQGGHHRFRFINAANARYFLLSLPGVPLIQIGTDGGFLPEPRKRNEILLVPGERADIYVSPDLAAGTAVEWKTLRYDRGHGTGSSPDAVVFQASITDESIAPPPTLPVPFAVIDPLPPAGRARTLRLEESAMGGGMMNPTFSINGQTHPNVTPLVGALGEVEDWSIENTTEMDHPFHLHGFRFQVLSEQGKPPAIPGWRDTINIPAKQRTVFRVRLDDHPGVWMFHCHILEHAERGMMGELHVGVN